MYTVNNGSSIHQVIMALEWGGALEPYTNGTQKPTTKHQQTAAATPTCQRIRPSQRYVGKQVLTYQSGIAAESVGTKGICMHLLTMPPGTHGKAHYHANHETAIYMISGESALWYGEGLEEHMTAQAGDLIYIPAGVPHLPYNSGQEPCCAVIARTDPNEQESVVLLPQFDALKAR